MTDITDQEREMRRVLDQMQAYVDNAPGYTGNPREWLRDLRAVFPAPAPTLAEELRAPIGHNQEGIKCIAFSVGEVNRLAGRAEKIEEERDYWKGYALDRQREVERLTAERDDRPATDLPDPAGVPAGEAWSAIHEGVEVTAVRKAGLGGAAWMVIRRNGDSGAAMLRDVTLVSRLVPKGES